MDKRWLRLGGLGLLVFIAAFITNFPAVWTLHLLQGRVPASLAWEGAAGSAFYGTVSRLAVVFEGGRTLRLDNISFDTDLLPLLLGRIKTDIQAHAYDGTIAAAATFGRQAWEVERAEGDLALETLEGVLPEIAIMGLSGRTRFSSEDWSGAYQQLPETGRLEMIVEDLRVALIEAQQPLGSYTLVAGAAPDSGITFELATTSADALLIIEGEGRIDPATRSLQFNGHAAVHDNAPEPVKSLLPLLGPVDNGRAIISWPRRY